MAIRRTVHFSVLITVLKRIVFFIIFQTVQLFLPAFPPESPRNVRFEQLSVDDGLSQVSVNCITQDLKGFMWFGTQDGLNKYDGYTFTIYRHDARNPNSISENHIRDIKIDRRNGNLWIATRIGGLNIFNTRTQTFSHYTHHPNVPTSISSDEISCLYQDSRGIFWIGTWEAGLDRFNPKKGTFDHYRNQPGNPRSLSHNTVICIYEDKQGRLWIGTSGGLNRLDQKTGEFIRYLHDPSNPTSISHNKVTSICEDKNGAFWVGTDGGGLNTFNLEKKTFTRYQNEPRNPGSLSHNRIRFVYRDHEDMLWIGTFGGGIALFDRRTGKFTAFRHHPFDPGSPSSNEVVSVYEDRTGLLWFGTMSGGINQYDRNRKKFNVYRYIPNDPQSLSAPCVTCVTEDSYGILWVGTDGGGLNRYDREKGTFHYYSPRGRLSGSDNTSKSNPNRIYSLYEDKEHNLWVGTFESGLFRFDKTRKQVYTYKHQPKNSLSLSMDWVRCLLQDHTGAIWVGTWGGGLDRLDNPGKRTFQHYKHHPEAPTSVSHDFISCLFEDHTGTLWVGTSGGGLNRFDPQTGGFHHYKKNPENPSGLNGNRIMCLYEDRRNILWIGTGGDGINTYDPEKNLWKSYKSAQGLQNEVINGILQDENGHMWMSTNKGITKFDTRTQTFKNYNKLGGLRHNEFNSGAYGRSSRGEMFFGGIDGFCSFFPSEIRTNRTIPPIVITDFKIFNRSEKLPMPISETQEIQIAYRQNFFSFEFAALNYCCPDCSEYAYQLEGFDDDWIYSGRNRTAQYTNLNGGTYTFKVKCTNSDGIWNEEGTSVKVIILPPFWQTLWFKTAFLLTILGIAVLFYYNRTYRIRRENKTLEKNNADLNLQISERKKAEAALKVSEEKYRNIIEHSIDTHFQCDFRGKFTMINPAGVQLLGYSNKEECLSRNLSDHIFLNSQDSEDFLETLKRNGKVIDYKAKLKRSSRTTNPADTIKDSEPSPILDVEITAHIDYPILEINPGEENFESESKANEFKPAETPENSGLIEGVIRDVTQRKKAEEENRKLQDQLLSAKKMEAVGNLAGGMAHEFNNLIAIIGGNAYMMEEVSNLSLEDRKRLDAIIKASDRCAELTSQLLSFSRKQMLNLKEVNLNHLIDRMEKTILDLIGDKIRLEKQLEPRIKKVEADIEMMSQVILGIVENARDAMPEGGELTIRTQNITLPGIEIDVNRISGTDEKERKGDFVCLSIRDTGIGMEENVVQRIFEPFFTTKRVGEGVGLDLSFVYGTVSQHNGWVEVVSAPGKGTTMNVILPAVLE